MLIIPLAVLIYSIILKYVIYNSLAMIILIALFGYMIISLIDLVNFICKYGLQRGEFTMQLKENSKHKKD